MSVYLTISLSVERYLSVVHPLLAIQHSTFTICLVLATPAIIFSVLFALPNYFILTTNTDNMSVQDKIANDSLLLERYYESLLSSSHDILLGSGHDSLLDSKGLKEGSEPASPRLVWAPWRNNQAFITVNY